MSKESYARGFCKAAAAAGVDPTELAKVAYTQADVDDYKKSLINAGNDASAYLTDQEKKQPLPSVEDIRNAFGHASAQDPYTVLERLRTSGNTNWVSRLASSLGQDIIMPKESPREIPKGMNGDDLTASRAIANIVRGQAVGSRGYFNHREIPESIMRGAWPAFTNAIEYTSAPARPAAQQVILGK